MKKTHGLSRTPEYKRDVYNRWYARHKEKKKAAVMDRYKKNPDIRRRNDLKKNYGITLEDYNLMFEKQGGACAVCGGPPNGRWKRLHVDHCHRTGAVRGLLCDLCNKALGLLRDDPEVADAAASYLRKAQQS